MECANHIVALSPEHPGFTDAHYRGRRDAIARIAAAHCGGEPVPAAPYTREEHALWEQILARLRRLHETTVCTQLQDHARRLALPHEHIPQLEEVNGALADATGFRMEPVAGLVEPRHFLSRLGENVFLATQYIRHHGAPFYTPEPDVVHELIGHAATLADPAIAALSRCLGQAAAAANDRELNRLENVYWYTLEFGVAQEEGEVRAFGAGLLSSCDELQAFSRAPLEDWDIDVIASTGYDPTDFQPRYFVAPSYQRLIDDLTRWVEAGHWRDGS